MLSAGGLKLLTATDWLSCCCPILSFVHRTNQRRHRKQTDRGQTSKRWFHSLSDNRDISSKGLADILSLLACVCLCREVRVGKFGRRLVALSAFWTPRQKGTRVKDTYPNPDTLLMLTAISFRTKTTASCYHLISRLIRSWHIYVTNPEFDGATLFLFLFWLRDWVVGFAQSHEFQITAEYELLWRQ